MTPEQIAAWAAAGESETLESKRTTGERREAARTSWGMLNRRGGQAVFGGEPDGRVNRVWIEDGRDVLSRRPRWDVNSALGRAGGARRRARGRDEFTPLQGGITARAK
jgi:hypothetical protein